MREISSDVTFEVRTEEVASIRVAHSTRVTVRCGTVWVTRSDDVEDYWLEPGQTLRLRRGERLWIGAEGDRPAWVAFALPASLRERATDTVQRVAARFGVRRLLQDLRV